MADIYASYPLSKNEARFLNILPVCEVGGVLATIHCELQKSCIDDALIYDAVSYVWGDPGFTQVITINGQYFRVRMNLWRVLLRLREEGYAGLLWIDAICINQEDVAERGWQVALMGRIYQNAQNVHAWLG
ncbi:HET-domain-containing protein, partial [Lizonia empirigonia]